MLLYEDDYHFPHYNSLGDYYQDDGFGNPISANPSHDRHIRDFINEALH